MVNIFQAKEISTPQLMSIPGVVGTGISEIRQTIIIYVKTITPTILSMIPKKIRGYKVEILEIGEVELKKW